MSSQMTENFAFSYSETNLTQFPILPAKPPVGELDLSKNPIQNFQSVRTMPELTKLNMNNTKLNSFLGCVEFPKLISFTAVDTPISKNPHFNLMAVICFGNNIKEVNGKTLDEEVLQKAKSIRITYLPFLTDGYVIVDLETGKLKKADTNKVITITSPQKSENKSQMETPSKSPQTPRSKVNPQDTPNKQLLSPEKEDELKFQGYPAKRPNTFYTKTKPVMSKMDYLSLAIAWYHSDIAPEKNDINQNEEEKAKNVEEDIHEDNKVEEEKGEDFVKNANAEEENNEKFIENYNPEEENNENVDQYHNPEEENNENVDQYHNPEEENNENADQYHNPEEENNENVNQFYNPEEENNENINQNYNPEEEMIENNYFETNAEEDNNQITTEEEEKADVTQA